MKWFSRVLVAFLVCSAPGLTSATPANAGAAPDSRLADLCACARTDPEFMGALAKGPGTTSLELLASTLLRCMLRVDGDPQAKIDAAARQGLEQLRKHADEYLRAQREAEQLELKRGDLTEVDRRSRENIRLPIALIVVTSVELTSRKQLPLEGYQMIVDVSTDRIAELEDLREEQLARTSEAYIETPEFREAARKGAAASAKEIEVARGHLRASEQGIAEVQEQAQAEAKKLFSAMCGR